MPPNVEVFDFDHDTPDSYNSMLCPLILGKEQYCPRLRKIVFTTNDADPLRSHRLDELKRLCRAAGVELGYQDAYSQDFVGESRKLLASSYV